MVIKGFTKSMCLIVCFQDLNYHYSPSRWSHRMGPEEVIVDHIQTLTKGQLLFN